MKLFPITSLYIEALQFHYLVENCKNENSGFGILVDLCDDSDGFCSVWLWSSTKY